MIDHATRFSVATLLKSKSKEEIVQNVFTHWIGYPYSGGQRKF